jgi:hypothetical protein
MANNPFDYINSINSGKNIMRNTENDDLAEKGYNAFIVNRGLSLFQDTVYYANEMNLKPNLDKLLQYEFFINIVRPKKRWSKWNKRADDKNVLMIQEYYVCNYSKAKQILGILTQEQLETIEKKLNKGGT